MSILMGGHAAPNEREANGYRWLWRGMVGAALAVTPLQGARAITTQEQPFHPSSFLSRGGIPATTLAGETAFVKGTQDAALEQDRRGRAFFFPGSPFKAAALQSTSIVVVQEQPRPASVTSAPGVQGPNVASGITTNVVTKQEVPYHPASYFWQPQLYVASTSLTPEARRLIVGQEQPSHPLPSLRPGVQGPNVGTGITSAVVVTQEAPRGALVMASAGVQGPNVASEVTSFVVTRQEQPGHPAPYFWPAQIYLASTVLSAETRRLIVPPEAPPYQAGTLRAGIQGPNVASGITSTVVVRQEQPGHPSPFTWPTQAYSTTVSTPPAAQPVITVQEQPFHPASFVSAGGLPATDMLGETSFVRSTHSEALEQDRRGRVMLFSGMPQVVITTPLVSAPILIRQEQPNHPAPYTSAGVPPTAGGGPGVCLTLVDGSIQEIPAQPTMPLRAGVQGPNVGVGIAPPLITPPQVPVQPPSVLSAGIQGPNVFVKMTDYVITVREQPGHPSPYLWQAQIYSQSGAPVRPLIVSQQVPDQPAPFVLPGVPPYTTFAGVTALFVDGSLQEQPAQPLPYLSAAPIFSAPIVLPAVQREVVTAQEQPSHPSSQMRPGVQGPNVGSGIAPALITPPQIPVQPPSVFVSGVQGPNVAVKVTDYIVARQEQPGHPSPMLRSSLQAQNVASGITSTVVTKQEQPFHPASFTWNAQIYVAPVFIPAGTRSLITTQETPFHPGSTLNPGVKPINVAPPPPVAQGGGGSWPPFAYNFETEDRPPPRKKRRRAAIPVPQPAAPPEVRQEAPPPKPTGPAPPPGLMGTALGTPVQPQAPVPVKVNPRVNHDDDRDLEEVSLRTFEAERAEIAKIVARIEQILKR